MSRIAIPILYYHRVGRFRDGAPRKMCVTPERFRSQMAFLKRHGFHPVTLDSVAAAATREVPLPPRAVALTFDDGFADVLTHAVPILHEYRFPSTMFVIAGLMGEETQGGMERMLTWDELGELVEAGVEIGSHTMTHRPLDTLSPAEIAEEVVASRLLLEGRLGREVGHFSYPKGAWSAEAERAVRRAGYVTACATKRGVSPSEGNLHRIRRIPVSANDTLWDFARKIVFHRFRREVS